MSDNVDLSNATLLVDSASGVYVPQRFAEVIKRDCVTGVSDEDYKVLEAGPEHEHYWDAWADVLDNAAVNCPKLGKCYLYQDGDLWIVPESPEPKIILGHKFVPMSEDDWEGFAGAEEGTLICWAPDEQTCLLLAPDGSIHETVFDDKGRAAAYEWKATEVNIEPDYSGPKR